MKSQNLAPSHPAQIRQRKSIIQLTHSLSPPKKGLSRYSLSPSGFVLFIQEHLNKFIAHRALASQHRELQCLQGAAPARHGRREFSLSLSSCTNHNSAHKHYVARSRSAFLHGGA